MNVSKVSTKCLGEYDDATGAWRSVVEVYVDGTLKERNRSLPMFVNERAANEVASKQRRVILYRWYRTLGVFVEWA